MVRVRVLSLELGIWVKLGLIWVFWDSLIFVDGERVISLLSLPSSQPRLTFQLPVNSLGPIHGLIQRRRSHKLQFYLHLFTKSPQESSNHHWFIHHIHVIKSCNKFPSIIDYTTYLFYRHPLSIQIPIFEWTKSLQNQVL